MRLRTFILTVSVAGLALTGLVAAWFVSAGWRGDDWGQLLALALLLVGVPTLVAVLRPRFSLPLILLIAALLGVTGFQAASKSGDGAIGGVIVLMLTGLFVLFALGIVGLRRALVHGPPHDE